MPWNQSSDHSTCRCMSRRWKMTSRLLQEQRSRGSYSGRKDWMVGNCAFNQPRHSPFITFPGLGAKSVAADQFAMELPGSIKRLQAVIGEEVWDDIWLKRFLDESPFQGEVATNILLASISTALHLGNGPITGQVWSSWNLNPQKYDYSHLAGRPDGKDW